MKYFKLCVALLLLCGASSAFALDEIRDLVDIKVPSKVDGGVLSLSDVKVAILNGVHRHNWTGDAQGKDLIMATLVNRGHIVVVDISFTQTSYSIKYKSSQNMDYDEKKHKIHKKYNAWVGNLSKEINSQLFQKSLTK